MTKPLIFKKKSRVDSCFVPMCPSTSTKFPNKLFLSGLSDPKMRKKWFHAAKRKETYSPKTTIRCCEDHFDLENDDENGIKFKMCGGKLFLKKDVVPHIFECQHGMMLLKPRSVIMKKKTREKNCQTRDAIVQPGVSQCSKELVVESETPQTNTNAPEDNIECTYSSSTESAVSDVEDLSNFTTYEEQRSSKNNDDHKPTSLQAAIETTTPIQHSELNRIEELELEEVQSGTDKPNTQTLDGSNSKEEIIERHKNTQISDGRNSKEEIIEQHKCYAIIANVYRYLKQEYEWLQRQLGSLYDVSALSDIIARTAAATGVSQRDVTRALHAHRLHAAIRADHSYTKGIARTSTTPGKSKNPGFSLRRHRKSATPSHTLKKKQEDHGNHGKRARPTKKRATKRSIRSKPSNEDQLLSKKKESRGSISCRKRQSNDNEEENDGESMGPPVRRSKRISVRSKPCNEEQLPFPSPIQLRVHGVMETQCKTEPADDDGQPTPQDDPLESGSWSHHHCEQATTTEETETLFKPEPADDECSQDLKPDPLELESSVATLQEPPDSPDTPQFEVKFECVDEDMNVCEDYSVFDPMHLDTKSKPPE